MLDQSVYDLSCVNKILVYKHFVFENFNEKKKLCQTFIVSIIDQFRCLIRLKFLVCIILYLSEINETKMSQLDQNAIGACIC